MSTDFGELGKALVAIEADMNTLRGSLGDAKAQVDKTMADIGRNMQKHGAMLSKAITAPIVAGAAAAVAAMNSIDKALKTIRVGTGATGRAMEQLRGTFLDTMRDARSSAEDVAQVVGQLNTRTGLMGEPLRELSLEFLNLTEVVGEGGAEMINVVTRVFGDWDVATKDMSGTLNLLMRVVQNTNVPLSRLAQLVVAYGAPMRQLNFSLTEAAVLFGKWEKEGVNLEIVMSGVRMAISKLARQGIDLPTGFAAITESIKNAADSSEAATLAMEAFGAKAGADLAAAIREGRFEIGDLVKQLENSQDTITDLADETETLGEFFTRMKNRFIVALAPLHESWQDIREAMEPVFKDVMASLESLVRAFVDLPRSTQIAIAAVVGIAAALGPLLVVIGGITLALPALGAALMAAVPALTAVTVAVGLITLAIIEVRNAWKEWGDDIKAAVESAKSRMEQFVRDMDNNWDEFRRGLREAGDAWSATLDGMMGAFEAFVIKIGNTIQRFRRDPFGIGPMVEGLQAGFRQELVNRGIVQEPPEARARGPFPELDTSKWREHLEAVRGGVEEVAKVVKPVVDDIDDLGTALGGAADDAARLAEEARRAARELQRLRDEEEARTFADMQRTSRELIDQPYQEALGLRLSVVDRDAIMAELREIAELARQFPAMLDDETIALLSGELWEHFGARGRVALEEVIEMAAELGPAFETAFLDIAEAERKSKFADRLGTMGEVLDGVGRLMSELPGKFRKFGQAAQSAARIVDLAMRAVSGSLLDIINLLIEAIKLLGIFGDKNKEEAKGISKIIEDIKDAVDAWADEMTDALVEFVRTGKLSFRDLADSIIDDLLRITMREAIVMPLIQWGGGILGFAKGGVFSGGEFIKAAAGTVVNRPTPFAHPGGLGIMGEGGGAGEAVMPLSLVGGKLGVDASGISGGDVLVEVHNYGPTPASVTESTDANGMRRVAVMIHGIVNQGLAGGEYDGTLSRFMGLNRRGTRG